MRPVLLCVGQKTLSLKAKGWRSMSNLTATLKLQHLRISNLLEAVQWIGIEKPEALRKLKAARAFLLAHLKLEDTLYKEFDKLRASARATVTEQTTDSRASTKGFVTFNSSRSSHLAPHL